MSENKNQSLIDGLRKAADFLEARAGLPSVGSQSIYVWLWNDKEQMKEWARTLGSFTKHIKDDYFELRKVFNEDMELRVSLNRESICRKIVTWDCGDTEESLLRLVDDGEQILEGK